MSMKGATRREARMVLVRKAVVAITETAASLINRKINPPRAVRRRKMKMIAKKRMTHTSEQEFRKATEAMCIDGGASLHSSHRQLKRWAREVNAAKPMASAREPLKWSHTPIIFDIEDHPDRTTTVGCLPLLVSPTICNLKVTNMLVDDGVGLNLIPPNVLKKLQIPDEDLKKTGTFQGNNQGRIQPKGKITSPVTFGGEINFRKRRLCSMLLSFPCHSTGFLAPSASQIHGGVPLCI